MRIIHTEEEVLKFDNGMTITSDHCQDCCEYNYADFTQIDDIARNMEFDEELIFEVASGYGFRFGNNNGYMVFVPCYSDQSGYYSSDVDIYFNGENVLNVDCDYV